MQRPLKYPLTIRAKEAAKNLVEAWNNTIVEQTFELEDVTTGNNRKKIVFRPGLGMDDSYDVPNFGAILELAEYRLIALRYIGSSTRPKITLLQELRNAVENDFEVSDFFLTTSAVGTIIYGNFEMKEGSNFQSGASGTGDVNLKIEAIPDELVKLLGYEYLQKYPDISQAIQELRDSNKLSRIKKMEGIIASLGRSIEHINNTSGAISAIVLLGMALGLP